MSFGDTVFWIALMQVIGVNIVLSGDNAVVIALTARSLPPQQQKKAILWGSGAAVVMRIVLTIVAAEMLTLPYLKLVGAALLLWIGVRLLLPGKQSGGGTDASGNLAAAIRTILIADLVMSLDNVIAVAATAKGSLTLLIFGLAISIPLVIFGSTFLLKFMDRFPVVITVGAGLLGWVAGDMATIDPAVKEWVSANAAWLHEAAEVAGAVVVVVIGKGLAARALVRRPVAVALGERLPAPSAAQAAAQARPSLFNRILVPVDGSNNALRAVEYVIALWRNHPARETIDIHLLNAQRELSGAVARFVPKESLQDYHCERGEKALERARKLLDDAGVKYTVHLLLGKPWEAISDYAAKNGFDHIVMGSRGLGSYTGGLLGSVAHGVAQRSPVPVVLVK